MYIVGFSFVNPRCPFIFSFVAMAPKNPCDKDPSARNLPADPPVSLHELHLDDLFFEQQASVTAHAAARQGIRWVDLPPRVLPEPARPPIGEDVLGVEAIVSPDKRIPVVYIVGSCEFSEWQLDPFLNADNSLLSVAPHSVNRYLMEGPISHGLFGPVSCDFVRVVNKSVAGQSWHEISVAAVDQYVADWCDASPSVTVLALGVFDAIMGHVAWTAEAVRPGIYGEYVLQHLELFLTRARMYCYRHRVDFEAWMVQHHFLLLSVPAWATLSEDMVSKDTVSVATWKALRPLLFRDMYKLESLLWAKYNAIVYCPWLPLEVLGGDGVFYRLGRRYSRLYVAQVLNVVAEVVCVRPACKLPHDSKAMKALLADRPSGDALRDEVLAKLPVCGPYFAWFVPQNSTFRQMYQQGYS